LNILTQGIAWLNPEIGQWNKDHFTINSRWNPGLLFPSRSIQRGTYLLLCVSPQSRSSWDYFFSFYDQKNYAYCYL